MGGADDTHPASSLAATVLRALILTAAAIAAWLILDASHSRPAHAQGATDITGTVVGDVTSANTTLVNVTSNPVGKAKRPLRGAGRKFCHTAQAMSTTVPATDLLVPVAPQPAEQPTWPAATPQPSAIPASAVLAWPPLAAIATDHRPPTLAPDIEPDPDPPDPPPTCPSGMRICAPTTTVGGSGGDTTISAIPPDSHLRPELWSRYLAALAHRIPTGRQVTFAGPPG